jgi:hypothetical protein
VRIRAKVLGRRPFRAGSGARTRARARASPFWVLLYQLDLSFRTLFLMLLSSRAVGGIMARLLADIAYNIRGALLWYFGATVLFFPSMACTVTVLMVPCRVRPRILRTSTSTSISTIVRLIVLPKILAFSFFRAV